MRHLLRDFTWEDSYNYIQPVLLGLIGLLMGYLLALSIWPALERHLVERETRFLSDLCWQIQACERVAITSRDSPQGGLSQNLLVIQVVRHKASGIEPEQAKRMALNIAQRYRFYLPWLIAKARLEFIAPPSHQKRQRTVQEG